MQTILDVEQKTLKKIQFCQRIKESSNKLFMPEKKMFTLQNLKKKWATTVIKYKNFT